MELLIYETELQKVNEAIALKETNFKRFTKVREVLKEFEGKRITKRIATAVQKAMPDHTVHWDTTMSWWELEIWKDHYDDLQSYNLGYFSQGDIFTMARFDDKNICHSLDEGRPVQMKALKRKLRGWVTKHNKAVKKLNEIYDECGDVYPYALTFRAGYRHAEIK